MLKGIGSAAVGISMLTGLANADSVEVIPKENYSVHKLNGVEVGKSNYSGLELKIEFEGDKITNVMQGKYSCDCKLEEPKNVGEIDKFIYEKSLCDLAGDVIRKTKRMAIEDSMSKLTEGIELNCDLLRPYGR